MSSSISSIKRIGESGKSTRELEKTIALLKKVVEKTQADNEMLKRSASGSGSEQISFLKHENEGLKKQLAELKHQMGATLSDRYTSQQKGTAKMMTDYEKLRKELLKEKESNEKLRIDLRTQQMEKEQQTKKLEVTKSKLEIEEAKRPTTNSDSKGWKSAVVTRMYEDQINSLESDIEKKNKQLADSKKLLKEATEREQIYLEEKKQLLHQMSILERLPPGTQLKDSDLMKEYQQARVKIDKLENEKKDLLNEIRMYRKGGSDIYDDDILTKAGKYDQMMEENVDVSMNLKSVALERDKYKFEVSKLKKELDNFGPDFFEEIEDLKYNYKQAVQKNVLYEEKLLNISKQFGIDLNIPGLE
ncbi:centrosomal protein of 290 kDa-like [Patella vulgata]|uniref:centrosomal protein of 290 kDa-like n=1 Tax=Patella vulgata TaxID=6465 RepID=UPI0024A808BF|nr:centrosomal protein of 290 kDa-like [Patella vulgata]